MSRLRSRTDMKILFKYLQPYRGLVALTITLAAINMCFSLIDPILFGKLVNLANEFQASLNTPAETVSYTHLTLPTIYSV